MTGSIPWGRQRGVVLLLSLLVLLLLALIAVTVSRGSLLQLHMAANEETRMSAMQWALAAIDNAFDSHQGLGADAAVGRRTCSTGSTDPLCDVRSIELDSKLASAAEAALEVAVERVAPHLARMPVMAEDRASSAVAYRAARFEITARYGGGAASRGGAQVVQGIQLRLAH